MALSQTAPQTNTSGETAVSEPDNHALKIDGLYNSASRLEVELEGAVRHGTATLTPGQMGSFNAILKLARELIPNSAALREDVDEVDEHTTSATVHQAMHVTIVPTLHNALPEPLYSSHG